MGFDKNEEYILAIGNWEELAVRDIHECHIRLTNSENYQVVTVADFRTAELIIYDLDTERINYSVLVERDLWDRIPYGDDLIRRLSSSGKRVHVHKDHNRLIL